MKGKKNEVKEHLRFIIKNTKPVQEFSQTGYLFLSM